MRVCQFSTWFDKIWRGMLHEHIGKPLLWFYDMKADGFSLDDKRTEIAENDIPDIISRFRELDKEFERSRTDKSFFVP